MERNILEEIEKEIDKWGISEKDKAKMHKNIISLHLKIIRYVCSI